MKFRALSVLLAFLVLLSPPWPPAFQDARAAGAQVVAYEDDEEDEEEDDSAGRGGASRIEELRGWLNQRQRERGNNDLVPTPGRNYGYEPPAYRDATRDFSLSHRGFGHHSRRVGHRAHRHHAGHHRHYRQRHYHGHRGIRSRTAYRRSSRHWHHRPAGSAHGSRHLHRHTAHPTRTRSSARRSAARHPAYHHGHAKAVHAKHPVRHASSPKRGKTHYAGKPRKPHKSVPVKPRAKPARHRH